METTHHPKVIIIGSGRVAGHLGKILYQKGFSILQVFGRRIEKASRLAAETGARPIDSLELTGRADLYILAVSDDAIKEVARKISRHNIDGLVVHTSGATPSTVLSPYFHRYGIFYPLQSFSPDKTPDFEKIPICIWASLPEDLTLLHGLGKRISSQVYQLDDQERGIVHLAAIFANNFTNHLYGISKNIMDEGGLPFELLHPLIMETARKILEGSPQSMQTGPAVRGDIQTIQKHLNLLEGNKHYFDLYKTLTKSINPDFFNKKK